MSRVSVCEDDLLPRRSHFLQTHWALHLTPELAFVLSHAEINVMTL